MTQTAERAEQIAQPQPVGRISQGTEHGPISRRIAAIIDVQLLMPKGIAPAYGQPASLGDEHGTSGRQLHPALTRAIGRQCSGESPDTRPGHLVLRHHRAGMSISAGPHPPSRDRHLTFRRHGDPDPGAIIAQPRRLIFIDDRSFRRRCPGCLPSTSNGSEPHAHRHRHDGDERFHTPAPFQLRCSSATRSTS